ncbi:MAG: hypothetical protein KJN96_08630 [Eudoraea sp.]|nr:hypothetical protein [Eudoraea sp.]
MNWKYILSIFLISGLTACGGGGDEPGSDPDPEPERAVVPSAATLVFPDNNSECNEGVIVNDTQSQVLFQWNSSQNTDSYEVNLRDLSTNNTSRTVSNTNSVNITLKRGNPYEWFVVSRAEGTNETANSTTWKFYNEGPGITNYAPFPATAVAPARGATITSSGTVILEWEGSDVDNDLEEYEVYFGTNPEADTLLETLTENTLETAVTTGQGIIYYWRILSRDAAGNTSFSEIFEFRVN